MNNNIYPDYIPSLSSSSPNNEYNYNDGVYAESIIRKNIGKKAKIYVSFGDSIEWRDKIFEGTIKASGRDFTLLEKDNEEYLIWNIYIDYILFY